jgi:hypothetical protein
MICKISPDPSLPKRGKRGKALLKRGIAPPFEKGRGEGFYRKMWLLL